MVNTHTRFLYIWSLPITSYSYKNIFSNWICSNLHVNGIVGMWCTYFIGSKRKSYSQCLDNICHFSASIFAPRIRFCQ